MKVSNGDETVASTTDISGYSDTLKALGIKTSVVTSTINNNTGLPLGETEGWKSITDATSGKVYDINSPDYNKLMSSISGDISKDINMEISIVQDSKNILSDLKGKDKC